MARRPKPPTGDPSDIYGNLTTYLDNNFRDSDSRAKIDKAILEYFHYPSSPTVFFNGSNKTEDLKNPEIFLTHRLERVRQLFLGFGIPPEKLHASFSMDNMLTEYSPQISDVEKFLHLNGIRSQASARLYTDTVMPYLQKAAEKITVYEYVSKVGQYVIEEPLKHYVDAHKKIFLLYEQKLKEVPYCRLLALPFPDQRPLSINAFDRDHQVELVSQTILAISGLTFNHICNCLFSGSKNFRLFVVFLPTRIYHFGLLDYHIVSEYYRYRSNGTFEPDLLFIERGKASYTETTEAEEIRTTELYDVYNNEVERLMDPARKRSFEVDPNIFIQGLVHAYHSLSTKEIKENDISNDGQPTVALNEPVIHERRLERLKKKVNYLLTLHKKKSHQIDIDISPITDLISNK